MRTGVLSAASCIIILLSRHNEEHIDFSSMKTRVWWSDICFHNKIKTIPPFGYVMKQWATGL